MRRLIVIVASILVSAVLLWIILQDVPLDDVAASIAGAHLLWVLVCLFFAILGLWTRGIRWRGLLQGRIDALDAFFIMGVTFLLNQLPLRAGEVARSLIAAQRGVPFVTAATSIVVERLMDTLLVVLLLAGAVSQLPDVQPEVTRGASLFGVLAVIGFGVLLFFAHRPQVARGILALTFRILPFLERLKLADFLEHMLDGLQPLTNWSTFVHALVWTLVSWATSLLAMFALIRSLDINENTILLTVLGITLSSLSIAIPVSVAGIGLFEGAIAASGRLVGIGEVAYTALGFLTHGVTVLSYILVGGLGLLRLGVSLEDVFQRDLPQPKKEAE